VLGREREEVKLKLIRKTFTDKSTIGVLQVDGGVSMFTLEDVDRKLESDGMKTLGRTAIPRSKYKVIIDFSNRFQREMLHVLNVPQFEGIRIHAGNMDVDTEGCILVGGNKGIDFISNSKTTLNQLFILVQDALSKGEEVTIDVT
jgi:hypothetical protein